MDEEQMKQIEQDLRDEIATVEDGSVRELSEYEISTIMAILRVRLGVKKD
jgi:hypothetical protein